MAQAADRMYQGEKFGGEKRGRGCASAMSVFFIATVSCVLQ